MEILTLPSKAESWIRSEAPVLRRCLIRDKVNCNKDDLKVGNVKKALTQSEPVDLTSRFDFEMVNQSSEYNRKFHGPYRLVPFPLLLLDPKHLPSITREISNLYEKRLTFVNEKTHTYKLL